jgi:hypothetical protein
MPPDQNSALDDLLIGVATYLEPSDNDRSVAENRYRLLKEVLERETSPFRDLLDGPNARIYAQGSVATSTVIVNGAETDRFDVDAIVQCSFPSDWTEDQVLDLLYSTLENFPGAVEVERCTRCVQVRFAYMHLDVTPLDRNGPIHIEHAGEIYHSPDDGISGRVPANPFGFSHWYRSVLGEPSASFEEGIAERRVQGMVDRLRQDEAERSFHILADAEQDDLPKFLPARLDVPQAIALRLLKRFLNRYYADLEFKRPPSIYLAKVSGESAVSSDSVLTNVLALTSNIESRLLTALKAGRRVFESNPTYEPDIITDRWPKSARDMEVLASACLRLSEELSIAAHLELKKMVDTLERLFGERVGKHVRDEIKSRYDNRAGDKSTRVQLGTGLVMPAIGIRGPDQINIPKHNFHVGIRKRK